MRDKCFSNGNSITRCEPANGNIICTYGKFGLSKLANVGRLKVCKSGEETISLECAAEIISDKTACFSPAEIAVTVCENMTDNELEKAAELSQKLGCALVDMGNIDRDISADSCERFEKSSARIFISVQTVKRLLLSAQSIRMRLIFKNQGCYLIRRQDFRG